MQKESLIQNPAIQSNSVVRYRGAIWTLLILAPVISEVLSGSTRLSILFVLIPEVMVWGCGALLCRELVRRWRGGATSLLMLGLALSIAEEFIIQQTSIAPLPFPAPMRAMAATLGVNWLYFLFMLGFESVCGRPGSGAGHGTLLPRSPRTTLAPQTRPHRHMHRVPYRLPHRLVRVDPAGAAKA